MKKHVVSSFMAAFMAAGLFVTLVSCAQDDNSSTLLLNSTSVTYKDAQEESTDFVSESLLYYKKSSTPSDILYARFYNGDHYVPYVSINYYLQTFDVFTPVKLSYSDGKYSYEYKVKGKSFPICIDVKNDTIKCTEWAGFIDEDNDPYESTIKKWLKVLKSYFGQKAMVFDLKKYGMQIYGGADDAYVPLCVLNQLFTARNYWEIIYNGDGVYFFESTVPYIYENYKKSSWYMKDDGTVCERPQKLIDLTYNMLCFTHDYCYGQPGYYGFADDGTGFPDAEKVRPADDLCFDDLLSKYGADVKDMLMSSDYLEYIKGLSRLLYYIYGDGHTAPAYVGSHDYLPNFTSAQRNELMTFLTNPENYSMKIVKRAYREDELKAKRNEVAGRTDSQKNPMPFYVLSGGKTAVFTFDSFSIDSDNWKAYYDSNYVSETPNPYDFAGWGLAFPNDPIGDFYKILYELLNNNTYSAVETVLIDVSCNRGGDDRCLMKLLAYLLNEPYLREYDVRSDTSYNFYFSADLNLDGEIDDTDIEYRKVIKNKFNFVVLASRGSFSCGNAFPVICADDGIPVIGEQSGGGACIVRMGCTADGFPYQFSNKRRVSHKADWSTIEAGAPITTGGEILDAADFYNDTKIQAIIDRVLN